MTRSAAPFRVFLAIVATTILGTRLLTAFMAAGYRIEMVTEAEESEPGFVAASAAIPAVDRSDAGTSTATCVASTKLVVRYEPFQVTATPGGKVRSGKRQHRVSRAVRER